MKAKIFLIKTNKTLNQLLIEFRKRLLNRKKIILLPGEMFKDQRSIPAAHFSELTKAFLLTALIQAKK